MYTELSRHFEELKFKLMFRSSLTMEVLDGVRVSFFFKNIWIMPAGLGLHLPLLGSVRTVLVVDFISLWSPEKAIRYMQSGLIRQDTWHRDCYFICSSLNTRGSHL